MDAHELYQTLKDAGVNLWVENEKLKWDSPGDFTDEIIALMKQKKSELISILCDNEESELSGRFDPDRIRKTVSDFLALDSTPPGKIASVLVPSEGDITINMALKDDGRNRFRTYKIPLAEKSDDSNEGKGANSDGGSEDPTEQPPPVPKSDSPNTMRPKIVRRGNGDFPCIFRPCRISEVYGQEEIKNAIAYGLNTGKLAHVLLFQGASGTGKTAMGRIVAMGLNCEKGPTSEPCCECPSCKSVLGGSSFAFEEFDAAHLSGVDGIRDKRQSFSTAPMGGEQNRIVLFDECHRLSKEAQAALLKPTEDVPIHLYFIFCTTGALLETLQNRCQQFKFKGLPDHEIRGLLLDVCRLESLNVEPEHLENIIAEAGGMPRNSLFLLQKAALLSENKQQAVYGGREK